MELPEVYGVFIQKASISATAQGASQILSALRTDHLVPTLNRRIMAQNRGGNL